MKDYLKFRRSIKQNIFGSITLPVSIDEFKYNIENIFVNFLSTNLIKFDSKYIVLEITFICMMNQKYL